MKKIISPSILAADFMQLGEECENILKAGADWLHLDVMDGNFVDNITFGPSQVSQLRKIMPDAFLDCHLMVKQPQKWVERFIDAGANMISIHYESEYPEKSLKEMLSLIRQKNVMSSLAINPDSQLEEGILELIDQNYLDMVLVMTVQPGFGGQAFQAQQLDKVQLLREKYPNLNIEVDGGVKINNLESIVESGANVFVSGTGIFGYPNKNDIISQFRQIIQN